MKKLLNWFFGADGKYKGIEYCDSCSGQSNPWFMNLNGDSILFYEKSKDGLMLHEFSKKELEANNDEFYFYEDFGNFVRSSIDKPIARKHEQAKIVFGVREIRILTPNRNIVFHRCDLVALLTCP
ncbi:hypothetical protein QZN10_39690 [Burkholderia contaminans]|jgi:hypothetical protein|uniref:hypothetical protein n=2 Tax=Pseudomonadota TaxID=1224 RepID=UPI000A41C5CD|nr:hypothetical protein [Burkholderia contaminans]MDN8026745.1 hypothetical protein [Burkholderia contaminans]